MKEIYQYDLDGSFIGIYPSVSEASRQTGVQKAYISQCTKFKILQSYGYVFGSSDEDCQSILKLHRIFAKMRKEDEVLLEVNDLELSIIERKIAIKMKRWQILQKEEIREGYYSIKMQIRKNDKKRHYKRIAKEDWKKIGRPTSAYSLVIKHKKPKKFLVYQTDMYYRYGIDFGRGDTTDEVIQDFLKSRGGSTLEYTVLYVGTYEDCQHYLYKKRRGMII